MNKFSDLGIEIEEKNIYNVTQITVEDVLNCEIRVIDFQANVKTRHGDGRCVLLIESDGVKKKFFTNASQLKEVLDKIPKEKFPFSTTIKQQRFGNGNGKTYYFT
ncbi:MAG: hypothetical protein FWC34_11005 [Bacteroidetes bacterium]|nr:hypothetical protein [Bacteroidota bacterium]MCL2302930.1 hypothetical protein [Lentimicrobiaceae bacterium]